MDRISEVLALTEATDMRLLHSITQLMGPSEEQVGPDYRMRLEWLMLVRLLVTTLLLGATIFFQISGGTEFAPGSAAPLYVLVGALFLLSLLYAVSLPRVANLSGFATFQIVVDVAYYTALVYFTGVASSAFTPIYIFPIMSAGILHFRRGALATAAVASTFFGCLVIAKLFGVIGETDWPWTVSWARSTPGYALWVMVVHFTVFFLTAFMASSLAEQLRRTRVSLTRTEQDYRQLSDLYSNIVRSSPNGIATTDAADKITFVNSAGVQLLGSSLSDLIGLPLMRVFPVIDEGLAAATAARTTYSTVLEQNGEPIHLQLTVSALEGEAERPNGRLVVFQDVTQTRKMEELARLGETQSAFVRIAAGMAHEVRNPLAALRGAAELLSHYYTDSEKNRKLFNIILREADQINALLTDFMTVVSAPRSNRRPLSLSALVDETIDVFNADSELRGHIAIERLIGQGLVVEGDGKQLKQTIWQLLSNAAEASPSGGLVKVTLNSDPDKGLATLRVQDFGEGIPAGMRDRIFEPFSTTKEKGTGLGLPLALSVVQAHNGAIEVDSDGENGAVFIVRLPLVSDRGRPGELTNG